MMTLGADMNSKEIGQDLENSCFYMIMFGSWVKFEKL